MGNGELPNSYDYHLHLNNYLPQHNISEASETDEQTPMLSRHPPPNVLKNGIRSPNANTTAPFSGISSFYRQNNLPANDTPSGFNDIEGDLDLNQSISALPELENESVADSGDVRFVKKPSNLNFLNSPVPLPAPCLSLDGHSTSNAVQHRSLQLTANNADKLFPMSGGNQDMDNLCELEEDSDCETPTTNDPKTITSNLSAASTPRVTRV